MDIEDKAKLNLVKIFSQQRLQLINYFAMSADFNRKYFKHPSLSLSRLSKNNPLVRELNSELMKLLFENKLK